MYDAGRSSPVFSPSRFFWTGLSLSVLGFLVLPLDIPVAWWFRTTGFPEDLHQFVGRAETFAHGIGVGFILLAILIMDPANRRRLPRVLAIVLGAGMFSNVYKLVVARARPRSYDGGAYFPQSIAETFTQFFPGASGDSSFQSFPSSHAATAAGMAVALAWLYPRGRWYFIALAMLASLQRLTEKAHFTSDVCWGASLGCFVGGFFLCTRRMNRLFERVERDEAEVMAGPENAERSRAA